MTEQEPSNNQNFLEKEDTQVKLDKQNEKAKKEFRRQNINKIIGDLEEWKRRAIEAEEDYENLKVEYETIKRVKADSGETAVDIVLTEENSHMSIEGALKSLTRKKNERNYLPYVVIGLLIVVGGWLINNHPSAIGAILTTQTEIFLTIIGGMGAAIVYYLKRGNKKDKKGR